jgi:hypothetical protein
VELQIIIITIIKKQKYTIGASDRGDVRRCGELPLSPSFLRRGELKRNILKIKSKSKNGSSMII